jgi:hypothetical protein
MEIITREEARAAGLTFYSTGRPCEHGHACERYVSSGGCVECTRALQQREYREQRAPFRRIARDRLKVAVFIICFLAVAWVVGPTGLVGMGGGDPLMGWTVDAGPVAPWTMTTLFGFLAVIAITALGFWLNEQIDTATEGDK